MRQTIQLAPSWLLELSKPNSRRLNTPDLTRRSRSVPSIETQDIKWIATSSSLPVNSQTTNSLLLRHKRLIHSPRSYFTGGSNTYRDIPAFMPFLFQQLRAPLFSIGRA